MQKKDVYVLADIDIRVLYFIISVLALGKKLKGV